MRISTTGKWQRSSMANTKVEAHGPQSTHCIFYRFGVTNEDSTYEVLLGTRLSSHKKRHGKVSARVHTGLPWAAGPSWWTRRTIYHLPVGLSILAGLVRYPRKYILNQCEEVHCILRTGEGFFLIRKKNLGPSDSFGTSFPREEWSGPRAPKAPSWKVTMSWVMAASTTPYLKVNWCEPLKLDLKTKIPS